MIQAKINPGEMGNKKSPPFITIESGFDESGWAMVYWLDASPESLRLLASQLEAYNAKHAESVKAREGAADTKS